MSDDEARRFIAEHAHYDEDLPFWGAAAVRLGSPVLDIGAAAGRVAFALARSGHRVWALDASQDMLDEIARRRDAEAPAVRERITPVRGQMQTLALGRTFPLAIIAMNTLQVLTEPADRLACLRAIGDHLQADGELIFDVAVPDVVEITDSMGVERSGGTHRDAATGATLIHSAWYDTWDPATHTLEFTLRVTERRAGAPERQALRHHRVHLFTPDELAELIARAGMEQISVAGDFDGSPIRADSERQIHRCRIAR